MFDVSLSDSPGKYQEGDPQKSQPSPHYAHGSAMGFFVTLTFH
jgi:hypothetical protein